MRSYSSFTFGPGDLKPSRGDRSWSNLAPHDLDLEAGEGVQGHGKSDDQVVFEDDLKRRRLEGVKVLQDVRMSASTKRSILLGEDSGEGGDVVSISRNEAPRAEVGQAARKTLKRKLYSETGNGPKLLE